MSVAVNRAFQAKLEELLGERGTKGNRAVRFKDLGSAGAGMTEQTAKHVEKIAEKVAREIAESYEGANVDLAALQAQIDAAELEAQQASAAAQNALSAAQNASAHADTIVQQARDDLAVDFQAAINAAGQADTAMLAAQQARDLALGAASDADDAKNLALGAASDADDAKNLALGAASDADDAKNLALGAVTNAQAARDAALGHKQDADTAKQAAQDAKTSAEQAKVLAEAQALAASNSAGAAAGSASTASSKATEASQSATAAAAQVVIAKTGAARVLPAEITDDYWRHNLSGVPGNSGLSHQVIKKDGYVTVPASDTGAVHFVSQAGLPWIGGRTYRITVTARAAQPGQWIRPWVKALLHDFTSHAWQDSGGLPLAGTGDWETVSIEKTLPALPDPAITQFRIGVITAEAFLPDIDIDLRSILVEDVTSEKSAAGSAAAAVQAQQAASASETAAGQQAAAAASSATTASTKAGEASTSASNAAQSETNAAGSASAASQSATTAAGSATTAGQKATAAAGSASTAATKATEASQSAQAAASSATTANTKAGEASTSAQQAASSKTDAAGSASSASNSATTAANSATLAGEKATAASGSATTASTKASEAAQSASAAASSATIAATKAGEASTSANQAAQSKTDAAGSASSASNSATAAAGSATTAGQKATAAAGSASTASTKATEASQSATAAASSATTASTKAGEASTSAQQAAQSKTDAAGSASSASISMTAAASSAAKAFPTKVEGGRFWTRYDTGSAETTPTLEGSTYIDPVGGFWTVDSNAPTVIAIFPLEPRQLLSNHTYRITASIRARGELPPSNMLRGFAGRMNNDYTGTSENRWKLTPGNLVPTVLGAWQELSVDYVAESGSHDGLARLGVRKNHDLASGAYIDIRAIQIEDVTSELAASGSASAASGFASTASTKATEASQSAQAAASSATTASTKAGEASTSAQQASASKTDAEGSASAAASSATTAANSATTAGQKATAASTSASQASTHATNAGSSAAAANTAKLAAESARDGSVTAKGQAEIARNDAVVAKNDANTAAAGAQSSFDMSAQLISNGQGVLNDQFMAATGAWVNWGSGGTGTWIPNQFYPIGRSYTMTIANGEDRGVRIDNAIAAGVWKGQANAAAYVVEVELTRTGNLAGAGVRLSWSYDGGSIHTQIRLADMLAGGSMAGTRQWARAVFVRPAGATGAFLDHMLYIFAGHSMFGTIEAKTLVIHRVNIRPATAEEMGSGQVMAAVQAHLTQNYLTATQTNQAISSAVQTVSTSLGQTNAAVTMNSTALSTLNGSVARFSLVTDVNGGKQAAGLEIVSFDGNGVGTGSAIVLNAMNIIAKGTLSADAAVFGLGKNLLIDPEWMDGLANWSGPLQFYAPGDASGYANPAYPVAYMYSGAPGGGALFGFSTPAKDDAGTKALGYPVAPGETLIGSIYANAYRCSGQVYINYYDAAGSLISTIYGESTTQSFSASVPQDGWRRIKVKSTVPTGAVLARFAIRKTDTNTGEANSYLFLWKPQLEKTNPHASEPSEWSPGGVAYINGGRLFANSILTKHLGAGAVTAEKISVASLSAISANMGTIQVGSGNIANLAVNRLKLAGNSVTVPYRMWVSTTGTGVEFSFNTPDQSSIICGFSGSVYIPKGTYANLWLTLDGDPIMVGNYHSQIPADMTNGTMLTTLAKYPLVMISIPVGIAAGNHTLRLAYQDTGFGPRTTSGLIEGAFFALVAFK